MKVFRIELLPAEHGDCIWIEYGEPPGTRHVLIGLDDADRGLVEDIVFGFRLR